MEPPGEVSLFSVTLVRSHLRIAGLGTRVVLLAWAVQLFCACGSHPPSLRPSPALPPPKPAPPPKLRLGDAARPLRYALELTVIPEDDTFTGTIDIDLELRAPTSVLWLNATGLGIERARLTVGGRILEGAPRFSGTDFLGLDFGQAIGPSSGNLRIFYRGALSRNNTAGLFKQHEGGRWYVYSQFEPIDARRAFPCFDEPSFKVPWQLTLHVKRADVAVSNTRAISETEGPNGLKTVKFAQTQPLPSYLIALAVGPFDVVESKVSSAVPIRVIAPHGRGDETGYAATSTPELLSRLEQYFAIPYPFDKLDDVAIPITVGFGAMENPGLITFTQARLLMRDEETPIDDRRRASTTTAHELAHQWFGDLVTLSWWNDVWLNEAFATWASDRIVEAWKPDWQMEVRCVQANSRAMVLDGLASARTIHQPIQSNQDIEGAFDAITYTKGAAVLSMFEHWVGSETFRRGVQRYLNQHRFGNATSEDFVAAISGEVGRDLNPAIASFLDQPGTPLITAELKCGLEGPPALVLSQSRLLPAGSTASPDQRWQIPTCFKYPTGKTLERGCVLVTASAQEVPLTATSSCPNWVMVNEGAAGYYRVRYPADLWARLIENSDSSLTLAERISVIEDMQALARAGQWSEAEALAFIPKLVRPPTNLHLVESTLAILRGVREYLVPDPLRSHYARFIRTAYGPLAKSLGWRSRSDESEDTRLMRPWVMALVADDGEEPEAIRQAKKLADDWLKNHRAVDPDVVDAVLNVAAYHGDAQLYQRLVLALKQEPQRKERAHLFRALSSFRDPQLIKRSLELLLSDEFDTREAMTIIPGILGRQDSRTVPDAPARETLYRFVKQNIGQLAARLPRHPLARLPMVASALCDPSRRGEAEGLFREQAATSAGGQRLLSQSLEQMSLCGAFKDAQQLKVAAFLRKY